MQPPHPASTPLSRLEARCQVFWILSNLHRTNHWSFSYPPDSLYASDNSLVSGLCRLCLNVFFFFTPLSVQFVFLTPAKLILGFFHLKLLNGKLNAYRIKANFLKGTVVKTVGFVFCYFVSLCSSQGCRLSSWHRKCPPS